jgi:hypothetical protein
LESTPLRQTVRLSPDSPSFPLQIQTHRTEKAQRRCRAACEASPGRLFETRLHPLADLLALQLGERSEDGKEDIANKLVLRRQGDHRDLHRDGFRDPSGEDFGKDRTPRLPTGPYACFNAPPAHSSSQAVAYNKAEHTEHNTEGVRSRLARGPSTKVLPDRESRQAGWKAGMRGQAPQEE